MGMFDRFYDGKGREWQTKAYGRNLDSYEVGDPVNSPPIPYQVEVFGGRTNDAEPRDAFATVRHGRLASVPDERDESLPLLGYTGVWAVSS